MIKIAQEGEKSIAIQQKALLKELVSRKSL